ncbi:hypothetical protein ABZ924_13565 [Streptomyces sp. NPDC046876]|uniref:hypothetical protein n=1 Tax=Streptomyces sp. NPDC046876 TaxID=3155616 RepID=UPI0033E52807
MHQPFRALPGRLHVLALPGGAVSSRTRSPYGSPKRRFTVLAAAITGSGSTIWASSRSSARSCRACAGSRSLARLAMRWVSRADARVPPMPSTATTI